MKPEQASFDKEALIKNMSGELRQWVTLLYLKLSISGGESMEVRPMKESVLREMDKLSLVEFRDVFREMFDSIDSHTERLKAVVQKLDEVLPPYGQAALHFELHALDRRRGRVIEVKPEVEQTAQKVRKVVCPKQEKEAGTDLGRLPVHIEQYFNFTEGAREREAAIVAASQERIAYLLEIQKQIALFDLSKPHQVKESVIQEHPEYAGARFRILAINNVEYTTADLETLKDLESKSQFLVVRLNGKKVYQLPAEYFVEA